ncbi:MULTISPECIES: hypothetical protein, partial [Burkholderia]|uniref:hypothetical protein n=1 Tax=Burkholderia TaxID=32008 RepID=UPI00064F263F
EAEERTNYPVSLCVDDLGEQFQLTAHTVGAVEPARVIAFIDQALLQITEQLGAASDRRAHEVNVLPQTERQQVLYD